jgi:hypothetical protein
MAKPSVSSPNQRLHRLNRRANLPLISVFISHNPLRTLIHLDEHFIMYKPI